MAGLRTFTGAHVAPFTSISPWSHPLSPAVRAEWGSFWGQLHISDLKSQATGPKQDSFLQSAACDLKLATFSLCSLLHALCH